MFVWPPETRAGGLACQFFRRLRGERTIVIWRPSNLGAISTEA